MTIEMTQALTADRSDTRISVDQEIEEQANSEYIDIDPGPGPEPDHVPDDGEMTDEEKAEIRAMEAAEAEAPY